MAAGWKSSSSAHPSLSPATPQPWTLGGPAGSPFSWILRHAYCPRLGLATTCLGPTGQRGLAHPQLQPGIILVDVKVSGPTWPGPGSH